MIERRQYLNKLIGFKDKHVIKVITGIRRCGKSTLLELFKEYLLKSGVPEGRIISINLENLDFDELKDAKKLHQYITDRLVDNEINYIFLDEIQNVKEFQLAVNSLFQKKNVDLYITGSNAYMLSGEIATHLSGRYVQISMMPLSFGEYVSTFENNEDLEGKYVKYLQESSFPGALEFNGDREQIKEYLSGIISTVILKDITARKKISDSMMLEHVLRFVFDNIGNQLSVKKISDTMKTDGRSINVKTVESYISAFMDSYIVYEAKRYDIKGRQHLKTLEKYYVVDIGLRYALLGSRNTDVGHILENVVYLELVRRGYEVYIGKIDAVEVDFVVMKQDEKKYFQVAATVRDPDVLKRELKPLQKISDHYPKYVLTLDRDPIADYDGITVMNALEFLAAGDAIDTAFNRGIVTGNADGSFHPERLMTRAEFAAMLTRALGIPGSALAGYNETSFKDIKGYGWAIPYLAFLGSQGILLGDGEGNVMPGNIITTKEAITMTLRAAGIELSEGAWPSNILEKAIDLKLYVDFVNNLPVTKDKAAQIICDIIPYTSQ